MSVIHLARPEIRALQPYASARMEASGGEVFLNANESPESPYGDNGLGCNRYPDPQPPALLAALPALYGVREEQVLVGRGSDEAIDLLVRAFCRAGQDAILIQPPTFGMYAVCARVQGAAVIEVPLGVDFTVDADALLAAVTPAVKLVFVCAPNNPTGAGVPMATLQALASALTGRALLVVDEAYVEFADVPSAAALINRHPHVAVLRTLSKAWALAGARVGCLLADAQVIALLRRIIAPYPVPLPCVAAALAALSAAGRQCTATRIAAIRSERARVAGVLAGLPGVRAVLPSQGNFLAVRLDDPGVVYQRLHAAGILVRDARRYPNLSDALRITIGTPQENDKMLGVVSHSPGEHANVAQRRLLGETP